MYFLAWILLTCSTFILAEQQTNIEFKIQPNDIWIGNSTKLTWSVNNADNIFISGLGRVTSSGMQYIRPNRNTSFTLIAENEVGIVSKTITIKVRGSRGESDFPNRSLFKYSKSYKTSEISLVNFLDSVHTILQDTLGFILEEYEDFRSGRFIFITVLSQKNYLIKQQDRERIAAWRIAYIVEIEKPQTQSKNFTYFIKAIIEYKRKAERKWRLEEDKILYDLGVQKLYNAINQSSEQ